MSSKDFADDANDDAVDARRAMRESLAQLRDELQAMARQFGNGRCDPGERDDGLGELRR